jgi:hypothetical protein
MTCLRPEVPSPRESRTRSSHALDFNVASGRARYPSPRGEMAVATLYRLLVSSGGSLGCRCSKSCILKSSRYEVVPVEGLGGKGCECARGGLCASKVKRSGVTGLPGYEPCAQAVNDWHCISREFPAREADGRLSRFGYQWSSRIIIVALAHSASLCSTMGINQVIWVGVSSSPS